MSEKRKWCIIGSGIMGMTLALRLSQQGEHVTIVEASDRPGGLADAWEMDGITWDRFYHVILMSDLHTRKVLAEIGLENELQWVETKTGFYSGGKLYSMSNIFEFFRFPPINLIDKFRLGLTIFVASKIRDWKRLEQIPVAAWLTRWSGKRVFDKIWLPLLKAKLGDNYKDTSAAFIWTTIQRMYAARKSGLKKEMFGYVRGGYDRINKRFHDHLLDMGVEFKFNSPVQSVHSKESGKLAVSISNGETKEYDRVISTLPGMISSKIAREMTQNEKVQHESIRYLGVICPSVMLKKAISPYYVTNITETWPPFTGVIEMTALIDKAEVGGNHLVYLPKYVNPTDSLFESSDPEIREIFLGALKKMYPEITDETIQFWGVSRARVVFALPVLGYSEKLPGINTSLPGFFIINSAQIINGTLNVNETIHVAQTKLKEIL